MSFGRKSDVHNHLFTKHPLVSHRMVEDNAHAKIVEPHDEERIAERASSKIEEPQDIHYHG